MREASDTNNYRVLYSVLPGRRIVLLPGFAKKARKLPRRELEAALSRLAELQARDGGDEMSEHGTYEEGRRLFAEDRARMLDDPALRARYEDEAAEKELWLQLAEARQAAGLTRAEVAARLGVTQSRVARIEQRGYDAYTLTTLRRSVAALGGEFSLEVAVRHAAPGEGRAEAPMAVRA